MNVVVVVSMERRVVLIVLCEQRFSCVSSACSKQRSIEDINISWPYNTEKLVSLAWTQ